MGKHVVFTGSESTGKTILATRLALDTGWPHVPEYAREWLQNKNRYTESDVYRMALGQYAAINEVFQNPETNWVADTDLLTFRIWLDVRYGHVAQWVIDLHRRQVPTIYLLCAPDLPWQADPLRENEHDRQTLFDLYEDILRKEALPYEVITGMGEERYGCVVDVLEGLKV